MISIEELERVYHKQRMLQKLFKSIISRNCEKASEYASSKITKYNKLFYELEHLYTIYNYDTKYISEVVREDFINSLEHCSVLLDEEKSLLINYFKGHRRNFLKRINL